MRCKSCKASFSGPRRFCPRCGEVVGSLKDDVQDLDWATEEMSADFLPEQAEAKDLYEAEALDQRSVAEHPVTREQAKVTDEYHAHVQESRKNNRRIPNGFIDGMVMAWEDMWANQGDTRVMRKVFLITLSIVVFFAAIDFTAGVYFDSLRYGTLESMSQSDKATKRVGEDGYGYLDVPKSWMPCIAETSIKLDSAFWETCLSWEVDKGMLAVGYLENTNSDAMKIASSIMEDNLKNGMIESQASLTFVGDYEACRIDGSLPDEDLDIIIWVLERSGGRISVITAEGSSSSVRKIGEVVESSFSFKE